MPYSLNTTMIQRDHAAELSRCQIVIVINVYHIHYYKDYTKHPSYSVSTIVKIVRTL